MELVKERQRSTNYKNLVVNCFALSETDKSVYRRDRRREKTGVEGDISEVGF